MPKTSLTRDDFLTRDEKAQYQHQMQQNTNKRRYSLTGRRHSSHTVNRTLNQTDPSRSVNQGMQRTVGNIIDEDIEIIDEFIDQKYLPSWKRSRREPPQVWGSPNKATPAASTVNCTARSAAARFAQEWGSPAEVGDLL